jgi:hypothetical protein
MKQYMLIVLALVLVASIGRAQFKSQVEQESHVYTNSITQSSGPGFLLSWFDPEKFHMSHTLSFSYMTLGGQGMSLGMYTNSMMYEFAQNLNARADVSMSYSPFGSSSFMTKGLQNSLSSVYLSRAEVNYKPWDNVAVQIQYRRSPYGFYNSPYGSPWFGGDGF